MPKNRILIACLVPVLAISGCKSQPEPVYVDLAQVQFQDPAHTIPAPARPPVAQSPLTMSLNAIPSDSVLLDSREQLARAKTLIDQDSRRARRSLIRQYTIRANADIDDLHEKKLLSLKPLSDRLRAEVAVKIRTRFEQYAAERGPLVAKVSSLEAVIPRDRSAPYYQQDLAQQVQLRAQIAQLDASYLVDRRKLQSEIRAGVDDELTKIQADVASMRANADEQAVTDADKQLSDVHASLPAPKAMRVQLEPIAGRSLTVPGTPQARLAPAVPVQALTANSEDQQRLIAQQVEIWARTNGYRLQQTPSGARNATNEFLQWIKERKLGP